MCMRDYPLLPLDTTACSKKTYGCK
jgi:hypothetical protein